MTAPPMGTSVDAPELGLVTADQWEYHIDGVTRRVEARVAGGAPSRDRDRFSPGYQPGCSPVPASTSWAVPPACSGNRHRTLRTAARGRKRTPHHVLNREANGHPAIAAIAPRRAVRVRTSGSVRITRAAVTAFRNRDPWRLAQVGFVMGEPSASIGCGRGAGTVALPACKS